MKSFLRRASALAGREPERWLPGAALLLFAFVLVHEAVALVRGGAAGGLDDLLLRAGIALLTSLGLLALLRWEWRARRETLRRSQEARAALERVQQRQRALFELNQRFAAAEEEEAIIAALLDFIPRVVNVVGVSFVPFDERERPLAAVSRGALPQKAMDVWAEHLARPEARQRCRQCEAQHALAGSQCPLSPPPALVELASVREMHCQRLWCGPRQMGMLTLYRADSAPLDVGQRQLLATVLDDAALRLDSLRLHRREMEALGQLKHLRGRRDMQQVTTLLLENVRRIFDASFAALWTARPLQGLAGRLHVRGQVDERVEVFVESILQAALHTAETVTIEGIRGAQSASPSSGALLVTPLHLVDAPPLGALAVGAYPPVEFTRRHVDLLQVIAGQMALVLQNASLVAELEYHTVREERARLAREIHDGLAQTLGFLKLQAAQMRTHLRRGDTRKLEDALDLWYRTVSEAYLDVREAIDGLRLASSEGGAASWIAQTLAEFGENAGIAVEADDLSLLDGFSPEVQAQLLRIVQESLTNVRKHARASRVQVRARRVDGQEILLEIRDDGRGFAPQEVSLPARHGLEGMRERAEMLGAEFQVISRPGGGTCIQVRLPAAEERHA